jgi:hypothetical protein
MRAMYWFQSPQRRKAEAARQMRGEAEPAKEGGVPLLIGGLEAGELLTEELA